MKVIFSKYAKQELDDAKLEGYLRVVDESGEDYLYPESYFILVQLPEEAQEALRLTA
jgi:hypothetical protein